MDGEDTDAIFFMEMDSSSRGADESSRRESDNPPEVDPEYIPMISGMFLRDEVIPLGSRMLVSSSHELQWVGPRGE